MTLEAIGRVREGGAAGKPAWSHPMPEAALAAGLDAIGL